MTIDTIMSKNNFYQIYEKYYYTVKKAAYSILHDTYLAEDISQEVFLLFLEKEKLLKEEFYRPWLVVNARRKAIDFCRRGYQVHEVSISGVQSAGEPECGLSVEHLTDVKSRGNGCEEEIIRKIILRDFTGKLFDDLAKKNEEWYEVIMRGYIEGESIEETSRALGISEDCLRAKRHRIKNWIRKNYTQEFKEV